MKKHIAAVMDKILTKGMSIMESEKAQKIMASPQVQKAMDLGIAALTKVNESKEAAKSAIAANLGLATQKDIDELRASLSKVEEKVSAADDAAVTEDVKADDAAADDNKAE